jgi:hypothetical protein
MGIVRAIGGGVRLLVCILDWRGRCGVHRPGRPDLLAFGIMARDPIGRHPLSDRAAVP